MEWVPVVRSQGATYTVWDHNSNPRNHLVWGFFFFIFFFQFSFQRTSSIFQQVAVNRGLNTELESVQCYLFYFFFTHAEMLYQRRPGCKKKNHTWKCWDYGSFKNVVWRQPVIGGGYRKWTRFATLELVGPVWRLFLLIAWSASDGKILFR